MSVQQEVRCNKCVDAAASLNCEVKPEHEVQSNNEASYRKQIAHSLW